MTKTVLMKSYLGTFTSHNFEEQEASVLIFDKTIHIGYRNDQGNTITEVWNIMDVDAQFQFATQATRIRNTKQRGPEISIRGNTAAEFIKSLQEEQLKPWHKTGKAKEWGRNLIIFFVVSFLLVALYFLVVPWMSEKLASKVSTSTEEQFGEAVYNGMGIEEDPDLSYAVNHFFASMDIKTEYRVRITVAKGDIVNAFALPGGRIVVYEALLERMETYPELAALLSHEFSHVSNQHSTRSIFRKLGSRIFISLLFGQMGTVTSILADQADNLKSLRYSRSLEKEADIDGLKILTDRKIDPGGFEDLFRHLKESGPANDVPEFLGSHPDTDKRIEYIGEASSNAIVEENTVLKTIFETIKQKTKP